MSKHVKSVHERNNSFKCEICDYTCPQKWILKQHLESVHEGKKLFKCDICEYSCSQKGHLTIHVSSVHERKKPFKCDICDKNFSQKQSMKNHFAIVHEEKKSNLSWKRVDTRYWHLLKTKSTKICLLWWMWINLNLMKNMHIYK